MKKALQTLKKNKYLIFSCMILIYGIITGTFLIKYIPKELCAKIFLMLSKDTSDFKSNFLDLFTVAFTILILQYLSGLNMLGNFLSGIITFANGIILGICKAINYSFLGTDYIFTATVEYFTYTLFIEFIIILIDESAHIFSNKIRLEVKPDSEKHGIKLKKYTVKFIAFTAISAVISAFSAYISVLVL